VKLVESGYTGSDNYDVKRLALHLLSLTLVQATDSFDETFNIANYGDANSRPGNSPNRRVYADEPRQKPEAPWVRQQALVVGASLVAYRHIDIDFVPVQRPGFADQLAQRVTWNNNSHVTAPNVEGDAHGFQVQRLGGR
jgi:hypothetical protein